MNPLLLLRGDTLGKTIYNYLILIAIVVMFAFMATGFITGKFWHWRADKANARADRAEQSAVNAQANAQAANGAATNATQTRGAIDAGTLDIRVHTDAAAAKVESNDNATVGAAGDLDSDLVRELDAARGRARAAADRLQRTRPR